MSKFLETEAVTSDNFYVIVSKCNRGGTAKDKIEETVPNLLGDADSLPIDSPLCSKMSTSKS
jgi:hypothetical protein